MNDVPPHSADPLHVAWKTCEVALDEASPVMFQNTRNFRSYPLSPDPLQSVSFRFQSDPAEIEGPKFHRRVAEFTAGSVAFLTTGRSMAAFTNREWF